MTNYMGEIQPANPISHEDYSSFLRPTGIMLKPLDGKNEFEIQLPVEQTPVMKIDANFEED
jgi:hypothetical protein